MTEIQNTRTCNKDPSYRLKIELTLSSDISGNVWQWIINDIKDRYADSIYSLKQHVEKVI